MRDRMMNTRIRAVALPYSGGPARAMVAPLPLTLPRPRMATEPQQPTADDQRRSAMMAAAQAGDRTAYETLLRDVVPLIRAVARRQGVGPGQVDDVVQEVLLTIHRARQTYDPSRSFNAWLRVIAEAKQPREINSEPMRMIPRKVVASEAGSSAAAGVLM